jgi:hypothetical protein
MALWDHLVSDTFYISGVPFASWTNSYSLAFITGLSQTFNILSSTAVINQIVAYPEGGGTKVGVLFTLPTLGMRDTLYDQLLATFPADASSVFVQNLVKQGIVGITRVIDPPIRGRTSSIGPDQVSSTPVTVKVVGVFRVLTESVANSLRLGIGSFVGSNSTAMTVKLVSSSEESVDVEVRFYDRVQKSADASAAALEQVLESASESDQLTTYLSERGLPAVTNVLRVDF